MHLKTRRPCSFVGWKRHKKQGPDRSLKLDLLGHLPGHDATDREIDTLVTVDRRGISVIGLRASLEHSLWRVGWNVQARFETLLLQLCYDCVKITL